MTDDERLDEELLDILAPKEEVSLFCPDCGWGPELCECDLEENDGTEAS